MNRNARLHRVLSAPRLTLYGLGTILGAGIYVLVGEVAGKAGMAAPLAYLIAAFIALFSGLTYAELSARYPVSAGEAAWVDESFSRKWLTMAVGWTVIFTGVVSAATLVSGFVGYLAVFIELPAFAVITVLLLALGALAAWGISVSAGAVAAITVVEAAGLGVVIGLSADALAELPSRWREFVPESSAGAWLGVGWASVLAFYAFIGFEDIVNVAEEVRKPRRNMPIAILWSLILATVAYVLVAAVAVLVRPPAELAGDDAPLARVLATQGHSPVLITLISLFAIVNSALVQLIMASRVLYGLADRGRAPRIFRRVHRRTRTPIVATLAATIIIWIAALALTIVVLAQLTSVAILAVFALVNLAAIRVKRREPAAGRRAGISRRRARPRAGAVHPAHRDPGRARLRLIEKEACDMTSPLAEDDHGVTLHLLGPGDAALLERVADGVFDYAVDPRLAAEFVEDPRHHMAVAIDDGTVVGMASAVDYVHPDKPRELWINEVAVAPTHRRSGIARRLLELLFVRGRERGCGEAWVGTEHDNVAACALYKGLGGQEGPFVLYSFRLRE